MTKTIYALASGTGRSGVAVVRISGDNAITIAEKLGAKFNAPKMLSRANLIDENNNLIDEAMAVSFPAPNSFTGENVVELHIHGSRAILNNLFDNLQRLGAVMAEPGEFSKQAFTNNKMDLTQAEGLIDLINAETTAQMRQAQRQSGGVLKDLYNNWADVLVKLLAHFEAYIDFPDEDLPIDVQNELNNKRQGLIDSISAHLSDNNKGERIREGLQVAIIGKPNAGKSSLVNVLAKRDVAIVSDIAGTTRDVIEVSLDINGYAVRLFDTAGIRNSDDEIEQQGVKRALQSANDADIILLVIDGSENKVDDKIIAEHLGSVENNSAPTIIVANKSEKPDFKAPESSKDVISISTHTGGGIDALLSQLQGAISDDFETGDEPLITRRRHRDALNECLENLIRSQSAPETELVAEDLRMALRGLGIITGQIDVEELLDIVFKDFCIGK